MSYSSASTLVTQLDAGIFLANNFASKEECTQILKLVKSSTDWIPAAVGEYENGLLLKAVVDFRATTAHVSRDIKAELPIVQKIQEFVRQLIFNQLGIALRCFSRHSVSHYNTGAKVARHRDTTTHSTSRLVTIILYLGDEFDGGELVFPDLGLVYAPKVGDLIVFASEHFHEVKPVLSGNRYCLISFGEI